MVQLHYDKDELWLIARKGKGVVTSEKRHQSSKNNVVYSSFIAKNNPYSNSVNNKHVLVKITGGAKNTQAMKEHFNYITRNDELPLYDESGELINLKEAVNEVNKIIDDLEAKKLRADARRTYQIAFSRSGKTSPELFKQIVLETVKKELPDNKFYFALHDDTKNTHIHVVVERQGKNGTDKLLRLDKTRLNQLKKTFAETQQKYGLDAVFLSETDKQKQRKFGSNFEQDKPKREDKRKGANEYKVLDFDKAPYEFKDNGKPSFYLCVETKNGEKKFHWSWGLQAELKQKNVRIGDKITLKKVRSLDMEQKTEQGKFQKSMWKIDVLEQSQGLLMEQFKVVDFGNAPYKFDDTGKPSFYMIVQNHKGLNKDYWGKALERMIKENEIKIGDTVIRNQSDIKTFIKVEKETATQELVKPLDKFNSQQGFKI
ncbi:TPA: relaxase/mobilization nuclease domain-containing protein [Haemophilus influenzae]